VKALVRKLDVQRRLGVPINEKTLEEIQASVDAQAQEIAEDLKRSGLETLPDREIVALIAYLQKLGKAAPVPPTDAPAPATVSQR
jgi:cytochrome c oxidase cbb3-type subunit I/II